MKNYYPTHQTLVERDLPTYLLTAKTSDVFTNITYEKPHLPGELASLLMYDLANGFKSVDVINEETGEVVYSQYHGDDLWMPSQDPYEAIITAEECIKKYIQDLMAASK